MRRGEPLQQSIRCMYTRRERWREEEGEEVEVGTDIYYTSNEVFDAANLRRTLPNYGINAAPATCRRRSIVADVVASADCYRSKGSVRRRWQPARPEARAACKPPSPADLHAIAFGFSPATAASMGENRPSSVAWHIEMTSCSYGMYVLISESPRRRCRRSTVQYRSAVTAAYSVLTQYELLRWHVSIVPISFPPPLYHFSFDIRRSPEFSCMEADGKSAQPCCRNVRSSTL